MLLRQIYDEKLAQYAYLVGCQQTGEALIIDPERDIDRYVELAESEGLRITAVAETHIHADYLSGAREFADQYECRVYVSDEGTDEWKYEWLHGSDYDYLLLRNGETFGIGNIEVKAVHTPGHTPEHLSFLLTDRGGGADDPIGIVTGDFVFVGDIGRPDLLESAAGVRGAMDPAARRLYESVRAFLNLPDYLQIWPGHGAGSACGKALGALPTSTVGYERRFNSAIQSALEGEEWFVQCILEGQPEPPLYFARMKRDNKQGPRILGQLPAPRRISSNELGRLAGRKDVAVVDTRLDRSGFMHGHLPGSIYAPLNRTFNTVCGSYIGEDVPIYLLIEEARVEEAVRDLVRIGLDDIAGFATPEALERYREQGGVLMRTPEIDFEDVAERQGLEGTLVLDVRRLSEFQEGHVPGAVNIAHTRLLERRRELPRERKLLVYCRTGSRSAVAAALLERYGHDAEYVGDLFANWASRHEVEKGTRPSGNIAAPA